MRKSSLLLFIFILLSCSRTSIFRMEGPDDFLNKYASDTLTIKNKEDTKNNAVENNIPEYVIVGLKKWKKDRYYSKKYGCDVYERERSLYKKNRNVIDEHIYTIKSCHKTCGYDENLIYVGKWEYLKKINKNIRLIACYDENSGDFFRYFEVMDDKNKDILYKPLNMNNIKNIMYKSSNFITIESNKETISTIQWFDRYGYNAYVDLKTGEIKQAKE